MIGGLFHSPMRRIFISYRRDDAQWFSARLADSLSTYFGDKRIFRDIEGIAGGADFGAVINESLNASDAVIVVIGPKWLDARDNSGRRRLEAADDWVGQEVGAALLKGVPVYPVLVEDTPMPRVEELPEALQALARFNAINVSDRRWDVDTTRLAKIVSLDIPSSSERRLKAINLISSAALVGSVFFLVSMLMFQLLQKVLPPTEAGAAWFDYLFGHNEDGKTCKWPPSESAQTLMDNGVVAVVFMFLAIVAALMFANIRHVDAAGRFFFRAAAWLAAVGTLSTFILYFFVCPAYEPIVNYYLALLIAPSVLALMSLSGFRAK